MDCCAKTLSVVRQHVYCKCGVTVQICSLHGMGTSQFGNFGLHA